MHCKVLVAVDRIGCMSGLAAVGEVAEFDLDFGLEEAGVGWHDALPDGDDLDVGLWVWEGDATFDDEEGSVYTKGAYRKLTPVEWEVLASGGVQLWPRGPNREPEGMHED